MKTLTPQQIEMYAKELESVLNESEQQAKEQQISNHSIIAMYEKLQQLLTERIKKLRT